MCPTKNLFGYICIGVVIAVTAIAQEGNNTLPLTYSGQILQGALQRGVVRMRSLKFWWESPRVNTCFLLSAAIIVNISRARGHHAW